MAKALLIAVLFGLLAAGAYVGYAGWVSFAGAEIPAAGYLAMGLGIIFSLIIGCGLMIAVFYSSRKGFDERAGGDHTTDKSHKI